MEEAQHQADECGSPEFDVPTLASILEIVNKQFGIQCFRY
jgi:hypothetical protein